MIRSLTALAWILSATSLAACPDAGDYGPTAKCTRPYDKCMLSPGVLGVCNVVDCPQGQPAPCLECRSQH